MTISQDQITGVILAGGRGTRMGGADKGLQNFRGMPMAMFTLMRLMPQVSEIMINANRNLAAYESFGVPVWPDSLSDYAGPLAGVLTALERCETDYLVTVPCDTPLFPQDLVARLAEALERQDAEIATASAPEEDGQMRAQPVFSLVRRELMESLVRFTQGGGRKIDAWTGQHRTVLVPFADAGAFRNANTLAELHKLEQSS
jgi:molybdopterin-guanine dinucleotide biosynthesis protein A